MARSNNTDSATEAQGRFVVSLPKEVGSEIDTLIGQLRDETRQSIGVGVELSRAQVVQSLVRDALDRRAAKAAADAEAEAAAAA